MLRLFRAASQAWVRPPGSRVLSSLAEGAARPAESSQPGATAGLLDPVVRKCELRIPAHRRPVHAWVESLRGFEQERVGLAELHPDVFATAPRRPQEVGRKDDLHIVDSLELPTADPQYLTELAQYRHWGSSVLLVDLTHEEAPKNVVAATSRLKSFNLIPAVGLNVYSMLKHQTLVLTLPSIAFLEDKLLWQDSRYTPLYPFRFPYNDFP
ncbi:39S ribosomal protein L4 [Cricetulus griseus]|uniref:Large ribosomal subunit protein uL4m n=1 Tax=Cricetulus griseus TaxID=10029 RepID=A0A061I7B6_CRIGR|nr:39S ribosomal protein L4 [Cricetulus griseus]